MKLLSPEVIKRRGCAYCADHVIEKSKRRMPGVSQIQCIHAICPYRDELDKFKNYRKYLASTANRDIVEIVIQRLKKK